VNVVGQSRNAARKGRGIGLNDTLSVSSDLPAVVEVD
jgi:hypothetical protein